MHIQKMKKIKNTIILLLLPFFTFGQIPSDSINKRFITSLKEEVICYTDRDLYLSGEEIWFSSAILINQKFDEDELSKVLYIELIGTDSIVIQKGKYLVENNVSSGNIQIPPETLSGVYFLRASTKYQRNKASPDFTFVPLTIVNTEFTLPNSDTQNQGKVENETFKNVIVSPNKNKYRNREKVTLDIKWPDNIQGVACVSVIRNGTMLSNGMLNQILNPDNDGHGDLADSVFYVPDIRGVSLSGSLRDKSTLQPLKNISVYLTVFGENKLLQVAKNQENGSFLFSLEDLEGTADVFVTVDPGKFPNSELMISNDFSGSLQNMPETSFMIDSTHKNILTAMLIGYESKKAFNLTNHHEYGRAAKTNIPDNFDLSVTLDDFIELGSLEETFFEIIPAVSVKSDERGKYLAVTNYQTLVTSRADLILLDNVAVFDVEELLKIPVSVIESIHVMNKPYYLGDQLFASIVSLKTKTGNFGGFKFPPQSIFLEYQNLTTNKTYQAPDYATDILKQSPVPDFRTTLYWNPSIKAGKSGYSISFYTSDDKGQFKILVRGITMMGDPVFGETFIEIE